MLVEVELDHYRPDLGRGREGRTRTDWVSAESNEGRANTVKLCFDCLDERDGLQRQGDRRTAHGEKCDLCGRIETDNPPASH